MISLLLLGDFVYISLLLALSLSGILLYSLIFPRTRVFEKLIIGTAFSFVFMIYLGFMMSYIATFNKISVIVANVVLIALLGIIFVFKNNLIEKRPSFPLKNLTKRVLESKWMLLIILLSIVFRIGPMFFSELPLGDDTTFHVLVAKLIMDNKEIPITLESYEPIPINYPIGSHIIIASFSIISEIAVHIVFKYLMSFLGYFQFAPYMF